ncbi:hypothetical protein WMF39_38175 [Sorangium sp. So ce1504]|uniref:hypothetical protein n=1 Tax=Sorangium sp. So ce1504 TaxID=3133337 RepID=UPI003F6041F7
MSSWKKIAASFVLLAAAPMLGGACVSRGTSPAEANPQAITLSDPSFPRVEPEAGEPRPCYWSGTAPFCSSDCGNDFVWGYARNYTEAHNLMMSLPLLTHPTFGNGCFTGSKALCCPFPPP